MKPRNQPKQNAAASVDAQAKRQGLIVGSFGRHYLVEDSETFARVICHSRGKKAQAVVGDTVQWLPSQDEGTIESVDARRNLLHRQDEVRTKAFAANLDQVLILVAAEPVFSEHQLARALIACEAEQVTPIIALNKQDLPVPFAAAWARLAPYRAMGYTVLGLSLKPEGAHEPVAQQDTLADVLLAKRTLVLGPSGAGKSTLVNRFVPAARAATQAISTALNSGKHTTTSTTWYWIEDAAQAPRHSALIDSPGFQEFGLHHIEPTRLAAYMPDFAPHLESCRFYNCTHLHEPGCGVRAHVGASGDAASGAIAPTRHKIYADLFAELSQPRF